MRCPGCDGVFYFFVHGNGAVELRLGNDGPAAESRLPPRVGEQDKTEGTRRIFTSRRRNRSIGGYAPFEKSRSYIGMFALCAIIGLAALAASRWVNHMDTIANATGRTGADPFQSEAEGKRKDFQARQKRALDRLKKQQTKVQAAEAKVELGRLPDDQTHD
jgi:hypothetical protein